MVLKKAGTGILFLVVGLILLFGSCISKKDFPVSKYYNYDHDLPLEDSVILVSDTNAFRMYSVSFTSVHNKRVTGLLSVPEKGKKPSPVIILLHGLGDRKTVDYIQTGHDIFIDSGYSVLRIDIANHGDRKEHKYDFSLTDGYRYWTRDLISQTVFDLRRSIDFLETRSDVDADRVGLFGISLGGIIGTIFSGVDERLKVPVIALAGGNLSLMFGLDALTEETKVFFSIIDPINFVAGIAPRPLLMINSENDEVIAPLTSKLLFNKARQPKEIIWYPSRHRDLPINDAYPQGVNWFKKHL
jgi:uncharacterized protein